MATPDTYGFKSPVYAAGNAILNQIFKCLFPDEMYVAGQLKSILDMGPLPRSCGAPVFVD